jgi:hypothetical protein
MPEPAPKAALLDHQFMIDFLLVVFMLFIVLIVLFTPLVIIVLFAVRRPVLRLGHPGVRPPLTEYAARRVSSARSDPDELVVGHRGPLA